tara:strand:+ start:393 stop:644 length:252 start_codon:yes stop_codon:yes gene_type:complete
MIKLLITFYISATFLLALPQDSNDDDWEIVKNNKYWIGYLDSDFPWCRGETTIDASMDEMLAIISDVNTYHTFFKSVFISEIN